MSDANKLAKEVEGIMRQYSGSNQWHVIERVLQIVDREKIMVLNRYLKKRGEPELIPEPQRYKENEHTTWLIDVPKEWTSLTGKTL